MSLEKFPRGGVSLSSSFRKCCRMFRYRLTGENEEVERVKRGRCFWKDDKELVRFVQRRSPGNFTDKGDGPYKKVFYRYTERE